MADQTSPINPESKPLPPEKLAELGLPSPIEQEAAPAQVQPETLPESITAPAVDLEKPFVSAAEASAIGPSMPVAEPAPSAPLPEIEKPFVSAAEASAIGPTMPMAETAPLTKPAAPEIPVAAAMVPEAAPVLAEPAPAVPEAAPRPETAPKAEAPALKAEVRREEPVKIETTVPQSAAVASGIQTKDEMTRQIEEIMSQDLEEDYKKLTPQLQQKFREQGEVTAAKIKSLMSKTKINVKKIIGLLIKWLRIIPHVDKYFLAQEAKIKADKLVHLKEQGGFDDQNTF